MNIFRFKLSLLIFVLPVLLACCESSVPPKLLISDGDEKRLSQITNAQAKAAKPAAEKGDQEAMMTMIQWSFQRDEIEKAEFWQNALQAARKSKSRS